jgi:hypothetical protein
VFSGSNLVARFQDELDELIYQDELVLVLDNTNNSGTGSYLSQMLSENVASS